MSFARIRAPGSWTANTVVTHEEFETFDDDQSKAIDGDAGGTYAPSSKIEVGGSGFWLTGANYVKTGGTWNFDSGGRIIGAAGSILGWSGAATFQTGTFTLANGAVVSGGTVALETGTILQIQDGSQIACQGPILIVNGGTGALTVQSGCTSSFAGTVHFTGAMTQTGECTFSGSGPHWQGTIHTDAGCVISIDSGASIEVESGGLGRVLTGGTWTFQAGATCNLLAPLLATGAGRVTKRFTAGTDSNSTYGAAASDVVSAANITAPRTYTLTVTGAVEGDTIRFTNPTTSALTIVDDSAITFLPIVAGSGQTFWADFIFHGVAWVFVASGKG